MKLNSILTTGTWADATSRLNTNFKKLETDVNSLTLATRKNKGFFATEESLKAAVPTASAGDIAYVNGGGDLTSPFKIYAWSNGAWVYTGHSQSFDNVNLNDYYTKAEIDESFLTEEEFGNALGRIESQFTAISQILNQYEQAIDANHDEIAQAKNKLAELEKAVKTLSDDLAAETNRATEKENALAQVIAQNAGDIKSLQSVKADKVELRTEEERAMAAEQTLTQSIDAIQKSVWGGEEQVVFDSYEVAVITPLTATQTAAGGSIVYVKNPNTDKANVNGFFYKLNDSYYWDAQINGVDVLLPFRDDERVLYPEKTYVCDGKKYYVENNFLALTVASQITEETERAMRAENNLGDAIIEIEEKLEVIENKEVELTQAQYDEQKAQGLIDESKTYYIIEE